MFFLFKNKEDDFDKFLINFNIDQEYLEEIIQYKKKETKLIDFLIEHYKIKQSSLESYNKNNKSFISEILIKLLSFETREEVVDYLSDGGKKS